MNVMHEQLKNRWGVLRRAVSNEVVDFLAGYHPGFERALGVSPRPGTKAALRDPQQKQHLWLEMWCRIADMIGAHETGYVRAFPHRAEWASRAAARLRNGILSFQQGLALEHSDVPRIEELRLDAATGRYYAVVGSAVSQAQGEPS